MRAVRGGDLAKLGALFERYQTPLFDFLSRTTGDAAVADDLVQDVFVRVLKYRHTFRDDGSFETWVFRIARNAKVDHAKRQRLVEPLTDEAHDVVDGTPDPTERLEQVRAARMLRRALMALRDDERDVLVLARYRNMKYEQIGEVLGIDAGAVKVRVHRAMKALRTQFLRLTEGTPHAM